MAKKKYDKNIEKHINANKGIKLDIGCGPRKQEGFLGMDRAALKGVDIVWDAEKTPYPLPDNICTHIVLSHVVEHFCPRNIINIMDEIWRIMKVNGKLFIVSPYAGSKGFWQDPTHTHSWNEASLYYFDPFPANFGTEYNYLYQTYYASPWKIIDYTWYSVGNMEIYLKKRSMSDREKFINDTAVPNTGRNS